MHLLSILVKTKVVLCAVAEVAVLPLLPYNHKQLIVCKAIDFILESRQLISIRIVRNRFSVEGGLFFAVTDGKTRDRSVQVWFTKHGHLGLPEMYKGFQYRHLWGTGQQDLCKP